jgi:hypothetical protein
LTHFWIQGLFHKLISLWPLRIPLGQFQILKKIVRHILNLMFIAGRVANPHGFNAGIWMWIQIPDLIADLDPDANPYPVQDPG